MAVLVAATETLLTPWNALDQYRYSYCNVASHSHQHLVKVDYVMLPIQIPRFLCTCLILPAVGSNPWFILLPILHLLCLASRPSESVASPLAFLHWRLPMEPLALPAGDAWRLWIHFLCSIMRLRESRRFLSIRSHLSLTVPTYVCVHDAFSFQVHECEVLPNQTCLLKCFALSFCSFFQTSHPSMWCPRSCRQYHGEDRTLGWTFISFVCNE